MLNMPFNLVTKFTEDLKEVPTEKDQFQLARQYLLDEINAKEGITDSDLRDRLSLLGYVCRLLERNDEALAYTQKALEISKKTNMVLLIVVDQMRLASCYQAMKDYTNANSIFEDTVDICESFQPLDEVIDFAYQQYAQCLHDQNQFNKSLEYLQKAKDVRSKKNNPELIAVTDLSIRIVSSKMNMH